LGNIVDSRCCCSVNVRSLTKCLTHVWISAYGCDDPELDLRVVRAEQDMISISGDECFSNFFSSFGPHRNILKVGIVAREPSRYRNSLAVSRVHSSCLSVDQERETIYVCRLQLSEFAERENVCYN